MSTIDDLINDYGKEFFEDVQRLMDAKGDKNKYSEIVEKMEDRDLKRRMKELN